MRDATIDTQCNNVYKHHQYAKTRRIIEVTSETTEIALKKVEIAGKL